MVIAMDDPNPYNAPRSPLHGSGDLPVERTGARPGDMASKGAARVGALIGCLVLIPAYLALFVMGRDPNGDGEWGWCLGSVTSGFGVGTLYGVLLGGGIGWIIGAIRKGVQ